MTRQLYKLTHFRLLPTDFNILPTSTSVQPPYRNHTKTTKTSLRLTTGAKMSLIITINNPKGSDSGNCNIQIPLESIGATFNGQRTTESQEIIASITGKTVGAVFNHISASATVTAQAATVESAEATNAAQFDAGGKVEIGEPEKIKFSMSKLTGGVVTIEMKVTDNMLEAFDKYNASLTKCTACTPPTQHQELCDFHYGGMKIGPYDTPESVSFRSSCFRFEPATDI